MRIFPDPKVVLGIGPLTITWYALFIMMGAILAFYLSVKNFKKYNVSKQLLSDFFLNVFIIGLIGARIWYVIFRYKDYYASKPFIDMFKIYEGGIAIQGGVIAGLIYGIYFFKKHKISILVAGDCIMPNLLIAQAIGRLGNFVNQEVYGTAVSREFLENLFLPNFIIDKMYINGQYHQPTFLYEALGNILIFILIAFIVKKFIKVKGIAFLSYFIGYGIIRYFVEGIRTDSLMFLGMRTAQITSISFILFGIIGIIFLLFKDKQTIKNT